MTVISACKDQMCLKDVVVCPVCCLLSRRMRKRQNWHEAIRLKGCGAGLTPDNYGSVVEIEEHQTHAFSGRLHTATVHLPAVTKASEWSQFCNFILFFYFLFLLTTNVLVIIVTLMANYSRVILVVLVLCSSFTLICTNLPVCFINKDTLSPLPLGSFFCYSSPLP